MPFMAAQASQVSQSPIVLPPLEIMPFKIARASKVLQFQIVSPRLEVVPLVVAQASQFMPKPKADRLDGIPLGILIVAQ